ncbi:unnamed protein product [Vitrella brassicaformis CCMP3155]|uniref:Uncharacterized protein n=2 Tax=Vitrella brassicaformis TaxID=1169539 RepID=A0A0G4ET30_VITBC|nr:unnamed protein product [Vitrella brassicaformis CCMP3155]|eukprot:CEM01576.1 unnamed protein product [Vitrella brassicaformis CCMP3155]
MEEPTRSGENNHEEPDERSLEGGRPEAQASMMPGSVAGEGAAPQSPPAGEANDGGSDADRQDEPAELSLVVGDISWNRHGHKDNASWRTMSFPPKVLDVSVSILKAEEAKEPNGAVNLLCDALGEIHEGDSRKFVYLDSGAEDMVEVDCFKTLVDKALQGSTFYWFHIDQDNRTLLPAPETDRKEVKELRETVRDVFLGDGKPAARSKKASSYSTPTREQMQRLYRRILSEEREKRAGAAAYCEEGKTKAMARAMRELCAYDQLAPQEQRTPVDELDLVEDHALLASALPKPFIPRLSFMDGVLFKQALHSCVVNASFHSLEALLQEKLISPAVWRNAYEELFVGQIRTRYGTVLSWSELCPRHAECFEGEPFVDIYSMLHSGAPILIQAISRSPCEYLPAHSVLNVVKTLVEWNANVNEKHTVDQRSTKLRLETTAVAAAAMWQSAEILDYLLELPQVDPTDRFEVQAASASPQSKGVRSSADSLNLLQLICIGAPLVVPKYRKKDSEGPQSKRNGRKNAASKGKCPDKGGTSHPEDQQKDEGDDEPFGSKKNPIPITVETGPGTFDNQRMQSRAVAVLDVLEARGLTRGTGKKRGGRRQGPILSLHCRDHKGNSLLHLAARYGWSGMIGWLLKRGVDPEVVNDWGLTALDVARKESRKKGSEECRGDMCEDESPSSPSRDATVADELPGSQSRWRKTRRGKKKNKRLADEDVPSMQPSSSSSFHPESARSGTFRSGNAAADEQKAIVASMQAAANQWDAIKADAIAAESQKKGLERKLEIEVGMADEAEAKEQRLIQENEQLEMANPILSVDELALKASADDVKLFQSVIDGRYNELQSVIGECLQRALHLTKGPNAANATSAGPAARTPSPVIRPPSIQPAAAVPVAWLEDLESSDLDIPDQCAMASQKLENINQDIARLACEVGKAVTRREVTAMRLCGLSDQNSELKQREESRLTKAKLHALKSPEDVASFQQTALRESQRLVELTKLATEHLKRLENAHFQRDVERRIEDAKAAREREAAE